MLNINLPHYSLKVATILNIYMIIIILILLNVI